MVIWTREHRAFAVEEYLKSGESVIVVQRRFRRRFNIGRNGSVPKRDTINRWVQNFRTTASAINPKPKGRPRSVRTPAAVERVRQTVIQSPQRSVRKRAAAVRMSSRTLRRILHKDLNFHPYKLMVVQQLNEGDFAQRQLFAERMQMIFADENEPVIMMSDEAHFYLCGSVNKQNCRYWAAENPRELHQRPLHSEKVSVWCAVSRLGVIGPYFFEDAQGATATVNSERYIAMLENFFIPELRRRGIDTRNVWFQQDGATAHTARASMEVVHRIFPGHVISRFGDVPWPPRSPDLSAADYFLWGYLKAKVYADMPRNLQELKEAITAQIRAIDIDLCARVMRNFEERLQQCIAENGRHLPDIIFKT